MFQTNLEICTCIPFPIWNANHFSIWKPGLDTDSRVKDVHAWETKDWTTFSNCHFQSRIVSTCNSTLPMVFDLGGGACTVASGASTILVASSSSLVDSKTGKAVVETSGILVLCDMVCVLVGLLKYGFLAMLSWPWGLLSPLPLFQCVPTGK